MDGKKAFVFDTNFIIENIKRFGEVVKSLSDDFNVYVTQVSIDERIAQKCREFKERFSKVEECAKNYSDIAEVKIQKSFEEVCMSFKSTTPTAYKKIFGSNIIPYDKDKKMFASILDRALMKTPPFPMNEKSDHGFKDTILWLSLIKYFKNNGEKEIVFLTEDKGFTKFQDKLIEEFEKETHKSIKIMPNSYCDELLNKEKEKSIAKISKPLPDFTSLRNKINTTIYNLCFSVVYDYWGNEEEKSVFTVSKKVDELDVLFFFEGLESIINKHILEKSVPTNEVFAVLVEFSPIIHSLPIDVLEQTLSLYKEIDDNYSEYKNQFYSAVASMFNINYIEPEENIISDDELPF